MKERVAKHDGNSKTEKKVTKDPSITTIATFYNHNTAQCKANIKRVRQNSIPPLLGFCPPIVIFVIFLSDRKVVGTIDIRLRRLASGIKIILIHVASRNMEIRRFKLRLCHFYSEQFKVSGRIDFLPFGNFPSMIFKIQVKIHRLTKMSSLSMSDFKSYELFYQCTLKTGFIGR